MSQSNLAFVKNSKPVRNTNEQQQERKRKLSKPQRTQTKQQWEAL